MSYLLLHFLIYFYLNIPAILIIFYNVVPPPKHLIVRIAMSYYLACKLEDTLCKHFRPLSNNSCDDFFYFFLSLLTKLNF